MSEYYYILSLYQKHKSYELKVIFFSLLILVITSCFVWLDLFRIEPIFIYFIGMLVSCYYAYKIRVESKNYQILILTGWILTLFTVDGTYNTLLGNLLFIIFPISILFFFYSLFKIESERKFKILIFIQLMLGTLSFVCYIFFNNISLHAVMVFLTLIFCLFSMYYIYFKELYEDKYKKIVLIISFGLSISILPYLIGYLLPVYVFKISMPHFSYLLINLFVVIFPSIVIYQMEKRIGLHKDAYYKTRLIFNIAFFIFAYGILELLEVPFKEFIIILYSMMSLLCIYSLFQQLIIKIKSKNSNHLFNPIENLKTEVEMDVFSNRRFESVADLLIEIVQEHFPVISSAILWTNTSQPYFILKSDRLSFLTVHDNTKIIAENKIKIEKISETEMLIKIPFYDEKYEIYRFYFLIKQEVISKKLLESMNRLVNSLGKVLSDTEKLFDKQDIYRKSKLSNVEREIYLRQLDLETAAKEKLTSYLHDDVLQSILALKNLASITEGPQDIKETMINTLDELVLSLRKEMLEIFPTFIYEISLKDAIYKLVDRLTQTFHTSSINFNILIELTDPFELSEKYFLYISTKELVTNVFKHSECNYCEIRLTEDSDNYYLTVYDNGKGINLTNIENQDDFYFKHIGLLKMKQELDYRSRSLKIYSRENEFSRFIIILPKTIKE
ncbi:MAG: hypothetical protein GX180_09575 [Enterococcus sp.]|nr:hypothetical protein [Enterococcus sp.]